MNRSLPRTIFDCNVLLQGFLTRGPAYECLEHVERKELELLISPDLLHEARDVFSRPILTHKHPQLQTERVSAFFALLIRNSILLEHVPRVFDFARDPKDAPYLDLALAGKADYLVTREIRIFLISLRRINPTRFIFAATVRIFGLCRRRRCSTSSMIRTNCFRNERPAPCV